MNNNYKSSEILTINKDILTLVYLYFQFQNNHFQFSNLLIYNIRISVLTLKQISKISQDSIHLCIDIDYKYQIQPLFN